MPLDRKRRWPDPGLDGSHNPRINHQGHVEYDAQDSVFGVDIAEDNSDWAWLQWDKEQPATGEVQIKDQRGPSK